MLKLNRTTEYSLMAISYIRAKAQGELTSAREIADHFELPFEILAKTLQKLKEQGIIASTYGTRGGYVLSRDLAKLNLAEFITIMEGPIGVVGCSTLKAHAPMARTTKSQTEPKADSADHVGCEYFGQCNIHPAMSRLNDRLYDFLHRISVEELTRANPANRAAASVSAPESFEVPALQGEEP